MNKTFGSNFCFILLVSAIALMLASCGVITTVKNASLSPTPLSPYLHYTPSKSSDIHIEFDYPSSWIFSENTQYEGFIILGLGDPRFITVPTRAPNESHGTPSDFGSIDIWITPSEPGQTPDTELELHKQSYKNEYRITLLKDYEIKMDGDDASVLEYQINDLESSPSLMYVRRTFFMVKEQMYEIYFTVAEKDRGGEFEQGYEYFFKSLKIVP